MADQITHDQFETWRDIIRSEQISHDEVPKLLARNPDFAKWYGDRLIPARNQAGRP